MKTRASYSGLQLVAAIIAVGLLPAVFGSSTHQLGSLNCTTAIRQFDSRRHKKTYYVGVHAPGEAEVALREYNLTFEDYLTATAGQRFDPPIEFKMKVSTRPIYAWVDTEEEVDFFYSDTGVYSCVGVEIGAQAIATTVSEFTVRGHKHQLDKYAGVIFTRAERDDINNIRDIKEKSIGATEIGDFAGAQVQFYAMHDADMDYIMDPRKVVFTGDQIEIVRGVARGDWEVGFVRTGVIERTTDEITGELLDTNIFKVLDPKIYVLDDGTLFPFLHSTPVFPELPFYSAVHTPRDVVEEVQEALLALEQHRAVGKKIQECIDELSEDLCNDVAIQDFYPASRCDTTRELASIAVKAALAGNHDGFRPPMSYFDIRNMQEAAGFLKQNKQGEWHCTRAETLNGAITCPEDHYKLSDDNAKSSCTAIGENCPDGFDCYCKPCVKAFEVDLYEYRGERGLMKGCTKMSLCASVEQTETIKFRAHDNVQRIGAEVRAVMHIGQRAMELPVSPAANNSWTYEFEFAYNELGIGILEFYVNGEQIPQSPIRVQIKSRNCNAEFRGQSRVSDDSGACVCAQDTIQIGDKCVSSVAFFVSLSAGIIFIALNIGVWYLGYKKRQSDQLWLVNVEELHFNEPVEVIGQGSFGVVLLAEYRGTKVAIKRVLPSGDKKKGGSRTGSRGSVNGSRGSVNGSKGSFAKDSPSMDENASLEEDLEAQPSSESIGTHSQASGATSDLDLEGNLDFLEGLSFGQKRTRLQIMFPWFFPEHQGKYKASILGSASGGGSSRSASTLQRLCPFLDKQNKQKEEFIIEMRLLSRLRHPCITTVMGAVISPVTEPMLVMEYMEYGSLHDLLRNETMYAGGEVILQICRDVAQGLRYLHSSKPPILHGDLKAKNILIDSRFRAKVADFGLSTKKKRGLSGTPYFMAPEYLRGKTEYNGACDIYSVGIILFEIYARKDPYAGENPRQVLRKVCDPRVNKRPPIPESCPPKMVDIMKKCWSPDPFFRPQAKDLDLLLMDMNMNDAEPGKKGENNVFSKPKEMTTEDMLYEVFPRHVADALKAGQKVEPESHENVTVVFSDIVHFTDISKSISALKVSQMLDRLYLSFDHIAKKHGIFKVETIGDAYMGVTNLNGKDENTHVKQVAEFAMGLIEAAGKILIDEEDPSRGYLKIRVGFHSGPVVSNVIGSLNPRYGLFGDTVNTASRMESASTSGRIHCSARSAKLLAEQAPEIPLTKRGKIGVKGKGEMLTYWVGSPASRQSAIADCNDAEKDDKAHVEFATECATECA